MNDSSCTLCENPYPYNCEHCVEMIRSVMNDEPQARMMEPPKKYIGSGEDVCLETLCSMSME